MLELYLECSYFSTRRRSNVSVLTDCRPGRMSAQALVLAYLSRRLASPWRWLASRQRPPQLPTGLSHLPLICLTYIRLAVSLSLTHIIA